MDENTQKILAGMPYSPDTSELVAKRQAAHNRCQQYNQTPETDLGLRRKLIRQIVPHQGAEAYFKGPIQFNYGEFTTVGDYFYANFNLTVLDVCPITIGDHVMCSPNVSLITAMHPLCYQQRNIQRQADGQMGDLEYGKPITIGDNCWLAANVTVCPGVTIGNGCVIGAEAVVTHDIPDNSLALGVPAKVVKTITEADRLASYPY